MSPADGGVCQAPWCDRPGGYADDGGQGSWCPWHASAPSPVRQAPPARPGGSSAVVFLEARRRARGYRTRQLRRIDRTYRALVNRPDDTPAPDPATTAAWAAARAELRARGERLPEADQRPRRLSPATVDLLAAALAAAVVAAGALVLVALSARNGGWSL